MNTYQSACADIGIQEQNAVAQLNEEINRIRQRVEFLQQNIVPNCENLPSDAEEEIKLLNSETQALQDSVRGITKHLEKKRKLAGCVKPQKTSSGKPGIAGPKGTNGRDWKDREECHQ